MNQIKIVKSDQDHQAAIERLIFLMDSNPQSGTIEEDEMEVLTVLIEQYENQHFPHELPSPIEAIKFRMEQQNLKNKDLVKFIGSASKVSEVLNGKRQLSLNMIRNLSHGLEISADVLVQKTSQKLAMTSGIESKNFPLKEMFNRNYFDGFNGSLSDIKEYGDELINKFFLEVPDYHSPAPTLLRSSANNPSNNKVVNEYSLSAWKAKVFKNFLEKPLKTKYQKGLVDLKWMKSLAQLSWSENGPLIAKEYLNKHGIALIIEPHLPKTYLDGAVRISKEGNPIVAMTLRHNRLDNFWFTLMHEIAHVALHINDSQAWYVDNLDLGSDDEIEKQADDLAEEALIPKKEWNNFLDKDSNSVIDLANKLNISPCVIAGRVRHENGDHRAYGSKFRDKSRPFFKEIFS